MPTSSGRHKLKDGKITSRIKKVTTEEGIILQIWKSKEWLRTSGRGCQLVKKRKVDQ